MKLNKLNDEVFYDFASQTIGVNVRLYKDVLTLIKTEKGVKLTIFLGGEQEDKRKVFFQDSKCIFVNYSHSRSEKDVSYNWVNYLLDNVNDLTDDEKDAIVDEYNSNLEKEIESYASQKRQNLIRI